MVDLSTVENVPLKTITLIHFILITWGSQGMWCPPSYLFYNLIFMLALVWGIHQKDSSEPVQIAMIVDTISIIFDVILLASYFPTGYLSRERFSVGMAILNLVFRMLSTFALYRIIQVRNGALTTGGNFPGNFGEIFGGSGGSQRSPYEDIDSSPTRGGLTVGNSAPMFPESKAAPSYHG